MGRLGRMQASRADLSRLVCKEAGIKRKKNAQEYLTRGEMVELLAFIQSLKSRLNKAKLAVGEVVPNMKVGRKVK